MINFTGKLSPYHSCCWPGNGYCKLPIHHKTMIMSVSVIGVYIQWSKCKSYVQKIFEIYFHIYFYSKQSSKLYVKLIKALQHKHWCLLSHFLTLVNEKIWMLLLLSDKMKDWVDLSNNSPSCISICKHKIPSFSGNCGTVHNSVQTWVAGSRYLLVFPLVAWTFTIFWSWAGYQRWH